MNHFLLADVGYHVDVYSPKFLVTKGRFGIHAMSILQNEKIPVVNSDVGGTTARKIFLMPRSFEVHKFVAVEKKGVERLEKREEDFAAQIARLLNGSK